MRSGLRFIRIQCNYPVCELAGKLGVTVEAVEDWENDRIPMPDAQAEKAAKIFGVDKTDIVDLTDQRKAELLSSRGESRLQYIMRASHRSSGCGTLDGEGENTVSERSNGL